MLAALQQGSATVCGNDRALVGEASTSSFNKHRLLELALHQN